MLKDQGAGQQQIEPEQRAGQPPGHRHRGERHEAGRQPEQQVAAGKEQQSRMAGQIVMQEEEGLQQLLPLLGRDDILPPA